MKYLKEYNIIKVMEDLEDYLQEFFDKYGLHETIIDATKDPNYLININDEYNSINIEVFEEDFFNRAYADLEEILPNIEKRLGQKITIGKAKYPIRPHVGNEYIVFVIAIYVNLKIVKESKIV